MRGYSKMNTTNSLTSIDMIMPPDHLDPMPIIISSSSSSSNRRSLKLIGSSSRELTEDINHPFEPDDIIVKGEVFGVILSRKSPPTATGHSHSHRFGHPDHHDHDHEHSSSSFLRRAFSMRRSCSVSERYCRIHDNFLSVVDDDAPPVWTGSGLASKKKKKKTQLANSKLLKACKRMFRL